MKKIILLIMMMLCLSSCNSNKNNETSQSLSISENVIKSDINTTINENEVEEMKLYIDDINLDVTWENNDSVKELMKLAKDELIINMHEYGGFEQTGSIGKSIKRNDKQIDVIPGDIVLYNGNAISIFYNPSSWSYTRLGHINLNNEELNKLLNKDKVILKLC